MAVNGRGIVRRNFPELVESAEVIEADVVAMLRRPAQALNPPFISGLLHYVPTVQRIAPALPRLAKEIRRNAGHHLRLKIVVKAEKVRVSPDVGAIVVDEDGDVANDTNGALSTVTIKGTPLLIERKLQSAPDENVVGKFLTNSFQSGRLASGEFVGPSIPSFQFVAGAQRVE